MIRIVRACFLLLFILVCGGLSLLSITNENYDAMVRLLPATLLFIVALGFILVGKPNSWFPCLLVTAALGFCVDWQNVLSLKAFGLLLPACAFLPIEKDIESQSASKRDG